MLLLLLLGTGNCVHGTWYIVAVKHIGQPKALTTIICTKHFGQRWFADTLIAGEREYTVVCDGRHWLPDVDGALIVHWRHSRNGQTTEH